MLALDHRGSMEKMLPASIPQKERNKAIIDLKQTLIETLAPIYSGVLLDPEFGLLAYKKSAVSAVKKRPFLLCIEKTGYTDTNHERLTELQYSVNELKQLGAKGVKLLLFFHPDAITAGQQVTLTKRVFEDCRKNGLPFFLEILNYPLNGSGYDPSVLVPQSVKIFLDSGITADVFKLEFPGTASSCEQVTKLLGQTPWILLTKGASYDAFVEGLRIAIENGARGFLAGRSIWQDFVKLPQQEWKNFIETTVNQRFNEICEIACQRRV